MHTYDIFCTRVVHHNRLAKYQALRGGPLHEPGHSERPPSHTMPESSLRSFRANVIPHSGSTRAPSCSRTALVGARPGTDCTGPDSAFSHDAGCQRSGVRPRHSRRHAPHHPVGAFALTGTASEGLRIACSDMAPMWLNHGPTARFSDLPFVNFRPQTLNHPLPRSARNHGCAPPHSLLFQVGTRPQLTFVNRRKSLYTGKTSKPASDAAQVGLRRELDGPGKLLAAMWLPRPAPRLPLGALAPNPWNQPLREAILLVPDVPASKLLAPMYQTSRPPWQQRRP